MPMLCRLAQMAYNNADTTVRTGQALFNLLPAGAAEVVAGTDWDPFYKDLTFLEVQLWIDNHLIFNANNVILAVFNDNEILWEA